MKRHAPATDRNREPIARVLERVLPNPGGVLEIASGTGQHAAYFAQCFPWIVWQPSDPDPSAFESIAAYVTEAALPNLRAPVLLDVCSDPWPVTTADAIVCVNMVHIAPWEASLALFAGAARTLPAGGLLLLYGPYRFHGVFTAPSNADFDASLRARDPAWGVRDVDDLERAAAQQGFTLRETVSMPANNHCLLFVARQEI